MTIHGWPRLLSQTWPVLETLDDGGGGEGDEGQDEESPHGPGSVTGGRKAGGTC